MKRIKHILTLMLCVALIFSCSQKPDEEVKIPATILNEDTFTKILVDFALAESAANLNVKNVPLQKIDSVYAFDPLKDYHVSRAKYDSTLLFYSQHTGLYKKIYEKVLADLSEMQTARDAVKKDSISLVKKDSVLK